MGGKKIKVSVIGATSIVAGRLLKYLFSHRNVELLYLCAHREIGKKICEVHTDLLLNNVIVEYEKNVGSVSKDSDLIFLSCGHGGEALKYVEQLISVNPEIRIIDFSGDFRLKDVKLYPQWYNFVHTREDLLQRFVYGLPEIYAEKIKSAQFVSMPGCYPTSILLGIYPLLKYDLLVSNNISIVSCSGVSGAGRTPSSRNLAIDVLENIITYKAGNEHQHIPELLQEIKNINPKDINLLFVPNVVPIRYGILSIIFVKVKKENLLDYYNICYKDKEFIHIVNTYPRLQDIAGTNLCEIYVKPVTENDAIVFSAIDNLGKGAAGQAVQSMNLMYDFEEEEGLL